MQESRTRLGIVALLPVLIVIGAAGWAAQGWVRLRSAIDPGGASQVIEIARGEALGDVRARLVGRGLLSPDAPLLLWARVTGEDREIRSGFYEISPAQTPLEILRTFVSGEVLTLSVTLPEGFTREQVFSRLTKQLDMERDSLEAAAADAAFVRSLGVPTDSLEGYLYPETYRFERGPNARHVIAALVAACFERFTDARCRKADSLGMSLHEVLTLASIVQAEAAQEEEMPHIAAVYHNRLSRGWLLQADPTVSYILGRQGQRLWEHHLEVGRASCRERV